MLDNQNYEIRYYASPVHYWNGQEFLENGESNEINDSLSANINVIENYMSNEYNLNSNLVSTQIINNNISTVSVE